MPWLILLVSGPFLGSFLGVLIRRLPAGRPVGLARSQCESCGRVLTARDLLPIVSYLALRGHCRGCGAAVGRFHIGIELAATAMVLVAASLDGDPDRLWIDCAFGWVLLALALIDFSHLLLPDVLTLPLIPFGLMVTLLRLPEELLDHVLAVILGYLGFRAIAAGYRAWRGRDGLGEGDAKLLAAAGAWLGLAALPMVVFIGALLTLALHFAARRWERPSPASVSLAFGPGLCLSMWLIWLTLV